MKTVFTEKNQDKTKRERSYALLTGSIIALIISITPYIFYIYESFPESNIWETSLFTYESKFYKNINDLVWIVTGKLVPLILLILWFFTCKHWWYHVLLIPISMYSFQLFSVLNDDNRYFDEVEIYYIIPIMMIVAPIVYLIRLKLFEKLVHGIDLKAIERELDEYKEKEREERKRKEEERKKRLSDIH